MPLSIKNPLTERLARQVAKQTGESITEAIQHSLQERLARLQNNAGLEAARGRDRAPFSLDDCVQEPAAFRFSEKNGEQRGCVNDHE